MKRSTETSWSGLKVGIVLMFAIAFSLWASLTGGGTSVFESKGKFLCYFQNVNGLLRGSPVWMAGMEVGSVSSVKFINLSAERQIEVVCRVERDVWHMLTKDAQVQLGTIGFLGDKYIEIIPGQVGQPNWGNLINDMDTVPTRDAGSAEAVFKETEKTIQEAGDIARNLNSVLGRMDRGEGTLGQLAVNDQLYIQLTEMVAHLTKLTAALSKNQERLTTSIERTSVAVADLAEKVDKSEGTVGKLLSDPALYDNLSATSARLDTVMNKLSSAEGSLGLLVSDTALYTETVDLLTRVNNLVEDIQNNPRKYFKFSVF